jgi:hypothetical protein
MSYQPTTSPLEGDLGRAIERLKELTERACGFLDAQTLNVISFTMAVHLDHHSRKRDETARMEGELQTEQKAISQAWHDLGRDLDGGRTS